MNSAASASDQRSPQSVVDTPRKPAAQRDHAEALVRAHTGVLEHELDHAADLDDGAVDWLVTVADGLDHDVPERDGPHDTAATSAPCGNRHQPVVPGPVLGPERHRHEMVLQRGRQTAGLVRSLARLAGVDIGLDTGREGSPRTCWSSRGRRAPRTIAGTACATGLTRILDDHDVEQLPRR